MQIIIITIVSIVALLVALFFLPIGGNRRKNLYTSNDAIQDLNFKKDFLWGTATAAQQVEQLQPSDWSAFVRKTVNEKKHAAQDSGDPHPGHILGLDRYSQDVIEKNSNFDEFMQQDLKAAANMGHNSYRFSFSFSRIFPEAGGKPDKKGIDFYHKILDECEKNNLKPSATIFHFSTPEWFWQSVEGHKGWERPDALEHFGRFIDLLVKEYLPRIDHWCTLNEPMVYLYNGYLTGLFPPNEMRGDVKNVTSVVEALLRAHMIAYDKLHAAAQKLNKQIEVGYTKHTRAFEAYRNWSFFDRLVAKKVEQAFIFDFMDAIDTGIMKISNTKVHKEIPGLKGKTDYVGINYYGRFYVKAPFSNPAKFTILSYDPDDKNEKINNLRWALYPVGFREIINKAVKRYGKPIYILENGTADDSDDDRIRQELLITHLRELALAQKDGADIRGYYHWSLVDNFEWAEGFDARFGLIKVDYEDGFKRTRRPSADIFKKIIEQGLSSTDYLEAVKKYSI